MNAPAAPIKAAAQSVQTSVLPLDKLIPSDTHIQQMRRERFDPKLLQELAASIAGVGLLQPLVCRPKPEGRFEIVAGERRYLAAKIAGLFAVQATVRDLTDEQVLEVQLVENLQREGLHELEEAEGYEALMKLKGITADEVAEKVGKSRSYVYARLKLLALDIEGRKAFYSGDIDASRALYVARVTNPKMQAKALELAIEKGYNGEKYMLSVRRLREKLTGGDFSIDLKTAPFSLDDGSFFESIQVKKGQPAEQRALPDCVGCPNRTGNCLDLFSQDDDPNVCMEPACFRIKVRQNGERLRAQAEASGEKVIDGEQAKEIVTGKGKLNGFVDLDAVCEEDEYSEPEPQYPTGKKATEEALAAYEKAEQAWQTKWEEYKPRTFRQILEGQSLPTVLVQDPLNGSIRTLVPYKDAEKAAKKAGIELDDWNHNVEKSKPQPKPKAESEAEKQKRLEQEERALERERAEMLFRKTLLQACFDKFSGPLHRDELVSIAEDKARGWMVSEQLKLLYGGKAPKPADMKDAELARLITIADVCSCVVGPHNSPAGLLALAKRLKIDPENVKKELKTEAKAKQTPAKKPAAKKAKKS